MNVYSVPYLAERRLCEMYVPPHLWQPPTDPQAITAPEKKNSRALRALSDVMLQLALEIKHSDDELHRANLTVEVVVCCILLHKLGYHAHADLGRRLFVQVTRLDALMLPKEELCG